MRSMFAACIHHAISSFERQLHLSDIAGKGDWHFDLSTSTLSFDNLYQWHAQLLGTESQASNTWLWAWANADTSDKDTTSENSPAQNSPPECTPSESWDDMQLRRMLGG